MRTASILSRQIFKYQRPVLSQNSKTLLESAFISEASSSSLAWKVSHPENSMVDAETAIKYGWFSTNMVDSTEQFHASQTDNHMPILDL